MWGTWNLKCKNQIEAMENDLSISAISCFLLEIVGTQLLPFTCQIIILLILTSFSTTEPSWWPQILNDFQSKLSLVSQNKHDCVPHISHHLCTTWLMLFWTSFNFSYFPECHTDQTHNNSRSGECVGVVGVGWKKNHKQQNISTLTTRNINHWTKMNLANRKHHRTTLE